jgi:hypothetical protein
MLTGAASVALSLPSPAFVLFALLHLIGGAAR